MKDKFRKLIAFSSIERKGIILLIVILLAITTVRIYLAYHNPDNKAVKKALLIEELADFERNLIRNHDTVLQVNQSISPVTVEAPELFSFDPNTISAGDLKRIGMDNKTIRTLVNYRLHGGKFRKNEDLAKIYGLSQKQYDQLRPYIEIAAPAETKILVEKTDSFHPLINLNLADSLDLIQLRGIGPVLSKRIIHYRKLLGGYYDIRQLNEVYGLTDSLVSQISPMLFADTTAIVKINVNKCSEYELSRHPYIGTYIARGIIQYRNSVHEIRNLNELKINGIVTSTAFEKVKNYLMI